jgi:hypothetical protein
MIMKLCVLNQNDQTIQDVLLLTERPELGLKRKFTPLDASAEMHSFNVSLIDKDENGEEKFLPFAVHVGATTLVIDKKIFELFESESYESLDALKIKVLEFVTTQWYSALTVGVRTKGAEFIWEMALAKNFIDKFLIQVLVPSPTPEERIMLDAGMTTQILERYTHSHRCPNWVQRDLDVDKIIEDMKGVSA